MFSSRRAIARSALGFMLGSNIWRSSTSRAQQIYPHRPVTLVVPYPAGGPVHFMGRLLAHQLTATLGGPFSVRSVVGDQGWIAVASVVRSRPDGYRLLVGVPGLMMRRAGHEAPALAPISLLARNPMAICVHSQSGLRSIADLVAAAQAAPGQIRLGLTAAGFATARAATALMEGLDIELAQVQLEGVAAAEQALMRNRIQVSIFAVGRAIPALRAGNLRALAVTSGERIAPLADVPTIAESGIPGYQASNDFVLAAPAETPPTVLDRLSAATMAVMRSPAVGARLTPLGIEPVGSTPAELASALRTQSESWGIPNQPR